MNKFKKIWNVVSTALVVLVVLCAVFLMGSRLLGYRVFNVISGSMEPTYSVGDLIYVKSVDVNDIKVGDPITFVLNENLVVATHRVVQIDTENKCFYTKGDANDTIDASPVHFKNVIGVPQFSVPLLGYVSDFIQNPPGTYIALAIGLLLVVAVFLPDLLSKKNKAAAEAEVSAVAEVSAEAAEAAEENERLTILKLGGVHRSRLELIRWRNMCCLIAKYIPIRLGEWRRKAWWLRLPLLCRCMPLTSRSILTMLLS